jgi:RNA polymerase sigma-70 factor (ECF subfamily)
MAAGGDVAERTMEEDTGPHRAVRDADGRGSEVPNRPVLQVVPSDPDAFAELYDRHAPQLLRWFTRRTTSLDMAADLTAETFAQAYLSRAKYDPERGEPGAWLFGIARHVLSRSLRRRGIEDRARRRLGVEPVGVPDLAYERVEQLADLAVIRPRLDAALGRLSPRLRDAVRLRVADGLPFERVAETLGCSITAARVRVTRGMQQLLDHMEPER